MLKKVTNVTFRSALLLLTSLALSSDALAVTNLAPVLKQRYFDANAMPLAGGKLYSYQSGTTTPQATFTDATGGTPNANPVVLDANGQASVWLDPTLSYKFVLQNSAGAVQWTTDGVIGALTANAVSTSSLQDLSVTTAKIADDAVTSAKLRDDASTDGNRAVTTDHVRNSAINLLKLSDSAIGRTSSNIGLSASVATNALTISAKDITGTDATATNPIKIGFRDSTATLGSSTVRSISAALSIVVPSSATLGHTSATPQYVWVYLLDNAGTPELAVSGIKVFDENSLQSTTSISVASTSGSVLYSTSARSGVPIRLIGRITVTEATAGTWATSPSEVSVNINFPFKTNLNPSSVFVDTGNGFGSVNTKCRRYTSVRRNDGSAITYADSATLGATFTINEAGLYAITASDSSSTANEWAITVNSSALTTDPGSISYAQGRRLLWHNFSASGFYVPGFIIERLVAGDVVRMQGQTGGVVGVAAAVSFEITKIGDF